MNYPDLFNLGIAIGLGFIIGVQRETENKEIAGVRTFTFISILGALTGMICQKTEQYYLIGAIALVLTLLIVISTYIKYKKNAKLKFGITTEIAILLTFLIGCFLVISDQLIGVICGAVVAVLLHIKNTLHDTINRMKQKEINAIMTFVGISLIVLPILPNQAYDRFEVLNPKEIWTVVVLIVGISVAGYFIYKLVGKKAGVISNGILGGLISSTATTVSYANFAKQSKEISKMAAFVILTASAVSFIRVVFEVGVIIPHKLPEMVLPLIVIILFMTIICVLLYRHMNKENEKLEAPKPKNPAQLKNAIIFGLLYGFILLVVAVTKDKIGNSALLLVSIISGLTDVDAITLSLSKLIQQGSLSANYGWKFMMIAGLSNLVFKGGMAYFIAGKKLFKWVGLTFGITIVFGVLLIWLWPDSWHLSNLI